MNIARHAACTALSFLIAASAIGQHHRIGYAEFVNAGQWDTITQYVVTFDAQGRETTRDYNVFDQLTGNWNLAGRITTTWTSGGQRATWTYLAFDQLMGTILAGDSSVYGYDAQDSLAQAERYTWLSGAWQLTRSVNVFRGPTGAQDSLLHFVHDGGVPVLRSRDRVTNDPLDRPIGIVADTLGVVWVTTDSTMIIYDTDGRVGQVTKIELFATTEQGERRTYTYDAQGFQDRIDRESRPPGGAFELKGWTLLDPAGDGLYNTVDTVWDVLAQAWAPGFRIHWEDATTAVPELVRSTSLRAFPNPATDQVFLPDLGAGVAVDLIAADGRVITGGRTEALGSLDIGDLSPGLHVIRAFTTNGSIATTIILKH
ncbi:MAG: T9SS type A sorting domain-containing protein [Flavobacteriales bacterium]|jgi:YD repeat-containing protein|nr:T9SS type A sorting domain-containing protein [Flavobacteriales bacterium]MBK7943128.1 T9SS type A sorting domain-containing protein [Flavobacteriales bacterium]MBK9701819.1 T9SS type A sorting domain-containing protein [Flavobacteriales bacterium]